MPSPSCPPGLLNSSVAHRETGKEQMAQVHYNEGAAVHIGPEPCAFVRKDEGEASVGARIGQPLSRERNDLLADCKTKTFAHNNKQGAMPESQ